MQNEKTHFFARYNRYESNHVGNRLSAHFRSSSNPLVIFGGNRQVCFQNGSDACHDWGTLVFVYVLMFLTPKIDPRRKNYQLFSKTYYILINAMPLIFSLINVLVIMTGLGYDLPAGKDRTGSCRRSINRHRQLPTESPLQLFFGIKNPWTLSSDSIWKKTHRFAAKVFTLAGLLIAADGLLSISPEIMLPVILATVLAPYIYSYVLYRKEINMKS